MSLYSDLILSESSLLRYYRLGENSGLVATESKTGTYNGTITATGVTYSVAGALRSDSNTALAFDGTSGNISIPVTGLPTGNSAISVEFWFNSPSNPASIKNFFFYGTGGLHNYVQVALNTNGTIYLDIGGYVVTSGVLATNIWHHVVGKWDGTTGTLYVKSVSVGTPVTPGNQTIPTSATSFVLASSIVAGYYLNGSLDDISIYNVALSASTIQAHYYAGITGMSSIGGAGTFAISAPGIGAATLAIAGAGNVTAADLLGPWTGKISGNSVNILAGSLSINHAVGRRSQASFTVWDTTGAAHYFKGQPVTIYDQALNVVFKGFINRSREKKPGFQSTIIHNITCMDMQYLADKRLVAKTYTSQTAGYIVRDILSSYLAAEGVTLGLVQTGPIIPQASFAYVTAAAALDALAKQSGFWWDIDYNGQLQFCAYSSNGAAWTFDGTRAEAHNTDIERANDLYRNTQYLIGGTDKTVLQNETRKGDSATRAFTMSYELAQVPTITVNSVAKTAGIKGIDTGKDFYWSKGDPVIAQDSSGTLLTSSDTLAVAYYGMFPSIVLSSDPGQIVYQLGIEGSGTGIVEAVESDASIDNASAGFTKAAQILARYAAQGTVLTFLTHYPGLIHGRLLTCTYAPHALSGDQMLIESIDINDDPSVIHLWWRVKAVKGPYDTTWVDYFKGLQNNQSIANSINLGSNQIIAILQTFTATRSPTATATYTVYTCPICGNSTMCGNSTIVC
jgi:hypothetical protein